MNAQRGSARVFARTVRDIIDRRAASGAVSFSGPVSSPPCQVAVFWGDRDAIIPVAHARTLTARMDGVRVTIFERCSHYPHHDRSRALAEAQRDFLDDPTPRVPRLRA
jgi:pimeloyl-ACP methyl ester carboxylesterase